MNITYETLMKGTNLFVGAHPDDNFLGGCNVLRRNPENSIVCTITNGTPLFEEDYPVENIIGAETPEGYARIREHEEKAVMEALGIHKDKITMLGISDQKSAFHMPRIIDNIAQLIITHDPTRIFTHEFPQAHPDHEVACFCAHQAAKETDFKGAIIEFPLYSIQPGEDRVNCRLTPQKGEIVVSHEFTEDEFTFRNGLMSLYASQPDIPERYTTQGEEFRVLATPRDFSGELAINKYIQPWIRELKPEQVHEMIQEAMEERNE